MAKSSALLDDSVSKMPTQGALHHGPEQRITRWQYEQVLDPVQQRLDANPQAMRQRRETVEHPCVDSSHRDPF